MFETLDEVRQVVSLLIAGDDFPSRAVPETLREAVRDYPCRGGKRLRPAITLWSCGVAGGDPAAALYAAAAVEVYHNWTLVHDDVIDRDAARRGEATSHVKLAAAARSMHGLDAAAAALHGERMAILAGDMQQAWAFSLLDKSPLESRVVNAMHALLARRGLEVISGEALDVEMALLPVEKLSVAAVEDMYRLKTGALLRCAAELGAAAAEADATAAGRLGDMASGLATAFQLRDDVLGLFGIADKFGKPIGSDLRERKPTLLLLETLERLEGASRVRFLNLLGHELTAAELDAARKLVADCGALAASSRRIENSLSGARQALLHFAPSGFRSSLLALLESLRDREV